MWTFAYRFTVCLTLFAAALAIRVTTAAPGSESVAQDDEESAESSKNRIREGTTVQGTRQAIFDRMVMEQLLFLTMELSLAVCQISTSNGLSELSKQPTTQRASAGA